MASRLKDLTRVQQPARAASGQVQVSYGVHHLEVAIAGKSVGEVRQALKEPLNIDPRALALVNGRDVAASYILKQGDQLEFVRLAGEKGADNAARGQAAWQGRLSSLPPGLAFKTTGFRRPRAALSILRLGVKPIFPK